VPIQKKLIETSLLTPAEVAWLNAYHDECRAKVASRMAPGSLAHAWMMEATAHI
jgi:Xaa-Pro aminopeptidase